MKVGILTNGAQWRFFTDVRNENVMDKEPFARWDVSSDDAPPYDVITLMQKSQFNAELVRAYAQRQKRVSEVVIALTALLEPASEFTKLAIQSLETRKVTEAVVKEWKPIVALTEKLWDYIKANPGLGIEAIGKALATPTSELTLPVRKLLAANRIRFEGERRGTKYSPM